MWWDQLGGTATAPAARSCRETWRASCSHSPPQRPSSTHRAHIERVNSEFAFVKDARRNKLEHGKANKLVALFHNLRLIKIMKD